MLPSCETSIVPRLLIQQPLLAKHQLRLLLPHPCDHQDSACADVDVSFVLSHANIHISSENLPIRSIFEGDMFTLRHTVK